MGLVLLVEQSAGCALWELKGASSHFGGSRNVDIEENVGHTGCYSFWWNPAF